MYFLTIKELPTKTKPNQPGTMYMPAFCTVNKLEQLQEFF